MAIVQFETGTVASLTTETVLNSVTPGTADGIFQLVVDAADMIEDDELVVRIKEKCRSGDTQRLVWDYGLQQVAGDSPILISPALVLLHGWDMTLEARAGTISVPWSIRQLSSGISEHNSGSQTCTVTTEHTLGTADDATDVAIQFWLDFNAALVDDIFRVRIREMTVPSGTKRVVHEYWLEAPFSSPLFVTDALVLMNAWDITLTQTAGTSRAVPWSMRRAA
jgi:hypothetical protein